MTAQFSLGLEGGKALDRREGLSGLPLGRGEIGAGDPLPSGPYRVGLTHGPEGDSPPWTICCADGRAIAGHVPSRECAEAIVEALNRGTAE